MQHSLRPALEYDRDFAFKVKVEAMKPHVEPRWGWDETFQYEYHLARWREKPWSVILRDANPIGTVSINTRRDHVQFGEFYLLKIYQRKGIGTEILQGVLADSDKQKSVVKLEYLKWNPVGSLYKRHGFKIVGETEIHYLMERNPKVI